MIDNLYKAKVAELTSKAKKNGKIKTYSQFCESKKGLEASLTKNEIIYYISKNKE